MKLEEFKKIKEGELLTIRNKKGQIIDIFHYNKIFELRHHNYCGEDYYYLGIALSPRLEQISKTTLKDIIEYHDRKMLIFNKQLKDILDLMKEI